MLSWRRSWGAENEAAAQPHHQSHTRPSVCGVQARAVQLEAQMESLKVSLLRSHGLPDALEDEHWDHVWDSLGEMAPDMFEAGARSSFDSQGSRTGRNR